MTFNELVKEESEEMDDEIGFLQKKRRSARSPTGDSKDSLTGTNEAKLNFNHFKKFKPTSNIKDMYEFKRVLGTGAFGTVYEAEHL